MQRNCRNKKNGKDPQLLQGMCILQQLEPQHTEYFGGTDLLMEWVVTKGSASVKPMNF